jgi:hypothetical protein
MTRDELLAIFDREQRREIECPKLSHAAVM